MPQTEHHWSKKDKTRYFISLIPLIISIGAAFVLMWPICIYMSILWLLIYLVVNIFQAGCCISCPYRGKYCPAIFGVYLGNMLSHYLYEDYEFDQKFFDRNAKWAELSLFIFIIYPLYWIYTIQWYYPLIYLALIFLHLLIFMPTQCHKCAYCEVCPGGKYYHSFLKIFRKK